MMPPGRWAHLEPVFLLFGTGIFVGLTFPLAQIAGDYGISPIVYAAISASGATVVLLLINRIGGTPVVMGNSELRYALVSGLLTYTIPFGTLIAIIPLIGSSVPAIFQSLIPIVTLGIAYGMGVEKPTLRRSAGLLLGLAGILLVLNSRNSGPAAVPAAWLWYAAALVTPVSLAFGNVYRTTAWPEGGRPLPLAVLTMASAAAGLVFLTLLFLSSGLVQNIGEGLIRGWYLLVLQCLFTGFGYGFMFRLQRIGGPVYVSQVSYIVTGVGVVFAVVVFAEKLSLAIWISAVCIFAGIALVTFTGTGKSRL